MNTTEMTAAAVQEATTAAPAPQNPDAVVKFSKPFHFEGRDYTEIDLSGMENMTAQDMIDAEKYLSRLGVISPIPEMTMEYIGFIANRATGQPIEFFKRLPTKEATKVKNKVTGFFYGED